MCANERREVNSMSVHSFSRVVVRGRTNESSQQMLKVPFCRKKDVRFITVTLTIKCCFVRYVIKITGFDWPWLVEERYRAKNLR